jgi:hypothetical protein
MDDQLGPALDPFRVDLPVAGYYKPVKRAAHAAHEDTVIVLATAQDRTRADLGVEVAQGQFPPHAG